MIHQTIVNTTDRREGPVYLRFGTVDDRTDQLGNRLVALGVELSSEMLLIQLRSTLIMTAAEAIRLSDELRRLASDVTRKARR